MMRTGSTPMVHMPGTPDCFVMAAEQGDPSKEASILKMKGSRGCALSVNRRLPISKVAEDGRVCHMH